MAVDFGASGSAATAGADAVALENAERADGQSGYAEASGGEFAANVVDAAESVSGFADDPAVEEIGEEH